MHVYVNYLLIFESQSENKKSRRETKKRNNGRQTTVKLGFLVLFFFKSQPHVIVSNLFFNSQRVCYKKYN